MLEGMFRVAKSSPVSEERVVTWRVYEAYDFASPIAYTVESVTVRRSSMTKDLKHDQLREVIAKSLSYVCSGEVHDQIKSPLVPSIRCTV